MKVDIKQLRKQLKKGGKADQAINVMIIKGISKYFGIENSSLAIVGTPEAIPAALKEFLIDMKILRNGKNSEKRELSEPLNS